MRIPIALLVALLAGSVLLSSPLSGQGLAADSAALTELRVSRLVRLETSSLERIQGTVVRRSAQEILLNQGEDEREVPLAEVNRAWVRGRATWTGAMIGAGVGLGAGIFLGELAKGLCEYDCNDNPTLATSIVGTLSGAALGAVIGAAIPRWKTIYRRE